MQILQLILSLISSFASVPVVGKILAEVVGAEGGLILVVNALTALWAAVVAVLQGLAKIPGLSGLASLASALSADYTAVNSWEQGILLPILQQISAVSIPVAPASVPTALKKS